VFNIVAVVTGLLALKEINRGEKTGKGMAMTGLILGAVFLLFVVVYWVLVAAESFRHSSSTRVGTSTERRRERGPRRICRGPRCLTGSV
jgi:hypothetical protein